VAWPAPGVRRQGGPSAGLLKRDASCAIVELGITARSRPAVPHPRARRRDPGPMARNAARSRPRVDMRTRPRIPTASRAHPTPSSRAAG